MTIFQNSLGRWVYHDGSAYQYFYTQEEAQMAANKGMIGETPAEIEIAATVTGEILPQLRSALLALSSLKMLWYANGIPESIEAALSAQTEIDNATEKEPTTLTEADTLIAGLPVASWVGWSVVFENLEKWLNTPLPEIGVAPIAVLMKRYVIQK